MAVMLAAHVYRNTRHLRPPSGSGLKDDDRGLVLKMLFRPFSDGLVKDNGTPPGVWDLATNLTEGKG